MSMLGSTEETTIYLTRDWVVQMSAASGVWPLTTEVSQRNQKMKKTEDMPKFKSPERNTEMW